MTEEKRHYHRPHGEPIREEVHFGRQMVVYRCECGRELPPRRKRVETK